MRIFVSKQSPDHTAFLSASSYLCMNSKSNIKWELFLAVCLYNCIAVDDVLVRLWVMWVWAMIMNFRIWSNNINLRRISMTVNLNVCAARWQNRKAKVFKVSVHTDFKIDQSVSGQSVCCVRIYYKSSFPKYRLLGIVILLLAVNVCKWSELEGH